MTEDPDLIDIVGFLLKYLTEKRITTISAYNDPEPFVSEASITNLSVQSAFEMIAGKKLSIRRHVNAYGFKRMGPIITNYLKNLELNSSTPDIPLTISSMIFPMILSRNMSKLNFSEWDMLLEIKNPLDTQYFSLLGDAITTLDNGALLRLLLDDRSKKYLPDDYLLVNSFENIDNTFQDDYINILKILTAQPLPDFRKMINVAAKSLINYINNKNEVPPKIVYKVLVVFIPYISNKQISTNASKILLKFEDVFK